MSLPHRQLRRTLTDPERILWGELRNRQLGGFKFRRQHPIGPYVVDFVCLESRLILELDGKIHSRQQVSDAIRTEFLESKGFRVIRFSNVELHRQRSRVLATIEKNLILRTAAQGL